MSQAYVVFISMVAGVYLAQNYNLPDVKILMSNVLKIVKDWENTSRKKLD